MKPGEPVRRTGFDRLMARLPRPRVLADFCPPPLRVTDGLYLFDRRERFLGRVSLVFRMTVVVLPGGGLWVHSPVPLDEPTRAQVDSLGPVVAIVAPNAFHYLNVAAWQRAFPRAELHLAPCLPARRPELPRGEILGAASTFGGAFDVHVFGPTRGVSEVVFVHRATRTLILTDLAKNVVSRADCTVGRASRIADLEARAVLFAMGARLGFGPDRNVRLAYLGEPERVRPDLEAIARLDFDRIVVNHGDVVETGGPKLFREAFARWL